ncbi:MAG: class I SAM-dependent methyltransferase [Solirubrobacteraceae bacterium]
MESVKLWYHTMELAPGEVTPGWFDLRPILDRLPWPDVAGKRCLDVGTYDGHLAFELERRGASEVIALDIADHESWDWPLRARRRGIGLAEIAGEKGAGFRAAAARLGSKAERVELSVYDATPERLGRFDVVVCGDLLLHLRDPVRAVEAIHGVCDTHFLSHEEILPRPLVFNRDRAVVELDGTSDLCQWWTPSRTGHQRIVEAGGFDVERAVAPYCVPFGPAHPRVPLSVASLRRRAAVWAQTRATGVPHAAVLARPI